MLKKRTLNFVIACLAILITNSNVFSDSKRPVEEKLKNRAEESAKRAPQEFRDLTNQGFETLEKSNITKTALQIGEKMPSFSLPDENGNIVSSDELLKNGNLILVFYRGQWCPYCNIYLSEMEKYLPDFKKLNASLVAISAEPPDRSLEVAKMDSLTYPVLSDTGLVASKKFGIVFEVPATIQQAMGKFDFNFQEYYKSEKAELPLSATYVVNPQGQIIYAFLEIDYKLRAEPVDIIEVLKTE
ncbi:MAG: AhpC/TSA family protein [Calditrichaeota bacterium]|nr:MAG: AhpC/TSA family protein [Calditrichota bacterium]